jgi:hypothetical protein
VAVLPSTATEQGAGAGLVQGHEHPFGQKGDGMGSWQTWAPGADPYKIKTVLRAVASNAERKGGACHDD